MPQPTEVLASMEDVEKGPDRRKWIAQMHQAAEGVDWEAVERSTAWTKHKVRSQVRKELQRRSAEEVFADGQITGQWLERGSSNQAGSVIGIDYHVGSDRLYTVGAGGSIWSRSRVDNDWTLVNDDIEFDSNHLHCLTDDNGGLVLLASINGMMHRSTDNGNSWDKATGLEESTNGSIRQSKLLDHPDYERQIVVLQKPRFNTRYSVYVSVDDGISYQEVEQLGTSDGRDYAMDYMRTTGDLYYIEQLDTDRSIIKVWNRGNRQFDILAAHSPIGAGPAGRINIQGATVEDSLRLYVYTDANVVYTSNDQGVSWQTEGGIIDETPWGVGLFVSESNPRLLVTGSVDAHRSTDDGATWSRINGWADYYGNPERFLHADIMSMTEFDGPDGEPFIIINNHGGMYISYDNTSRNENISLEGLHVSQYYDVETNPGDEEFMVAGSQDQGLQRGYIFDDGPQALEQVISGDYGHITWERNGDRMWAVYPFGLVHYYRDAQFGGVSAGYTIESQDEGVWITPMMHDPDDRAPIAYIAGGSATGGRGKFLIKLEYSNFSITAIDMPFDFSVSGGDITAMEVDPLDENIWYVATSNGQLWRSEDRGLSFTEMASNIPNGHYLYGADILCSNQDQDKLVVCGSGYSTPAMRISDNGGTTWRSAITDLPNTLVHEIAYNADESIIYAATEAGPYAYIVAEDRWYDITGIDVPAQRYWSVEYLPKSNILRYGTYGRGAFDFVLSEISVDVQESTADNHLVIYPNPTTDYVQIKGDVEYDEVVVVSLDGQVMYTGPYADKVNVEDYTSGTYIIIAQNSRQRYQGRFVKM